MKLRAPDGCCGLVHGGRFIAIDAKGCIDIDAAQAPALACHGFEAMADAPTDDVRTKVSPAQDAPDFDAMNRTALFAYLREQGVTVTLPITNEALRAAARQAAS